MIRLWTRKLGGFGWVTRRTIRSVGDGGRMVRLAGSEILRFWPDDPRTGDSSRLWRPDDPDFSQSFEAPCKKAVKTTCHGLDSRPLDYQLPRP